MLRKDQMLWKLGLLKNCYKNVKGTLNFSVGYQSVTMHKLLSPALVQMKGKTDAQEMLQQDNTPKQNGFGGGGLGPLLCHDPSWLIFH